MTYRDSASLANAGEQVSALTQLGDNEPLNLAIADAERTMAVDAGLASTSQGLIDAELPQSMELAPETGGASLIVGAGVAIGAGLFAAIVDPSTGAAPAVPMPSFNPTGVDLAANWSRTAALLIVPATSTWRTLSRSQAGGQDGHRATPAVAVAGRACRHKPGVPDTSQRPTGPCLRGQLAVQRQHG